MKLMMKKELQERKWRSSSCQKRVKIPISCEQKFLMLTEWWGIKGSFVSYIPPLAMDARPRSDLRKCVIRRQLILVVHPDDTIPGIPLSGILIFFCPLLLRTVYVFLLSFFLFFYSFPYRIYTSSCFVVPSIKENNRADLNLLRYVSFLSKTTYQHLQIQ